MAKNKYLTEYPKQLKKEAKQLDMKIKKSDYKFLDQVLVSLELHEFPQTDVTIDPVSEDIKLHFQTERGVDICMQMDPSDTDAVGFTARVGSISKEAAGSVGIKILKGDFIDNDLALQITLEPIGNSCFEIVMKGQPWIDRKGKHAAGLSCFYMLCLILQGNEVMHVLKDKAQYPAYDLRVTSFGENKVKVIKLIRQISGLGLREAKEIAEAAPGAVIHTGSAEEFFKVQMMLKEVGALAEIAL